MPTTEGENLVKRRGRRKLLTEAEEREIYTLYRVANWSAESILKRFPVLSGTSSVRMIAARVEQSLNKNPGANGAANTSPGGPNGQEHQAEGTQSKGTPDAEG